MKVTTYRDESRFISREKIKEARESLAYTIGFVSFNKQHPFILLKTRSLFSNCFISDSGFNFVIGISDSLNDSNELESELNKLNHHMISKYSPRDINIDLLRDYITRYLQEKLYIFPELEKTLAIELILIEANFSQTRTQIVNFDGNIRYLSPDDKFVLIGCPDETKREQFRRKFEELKLYKLSCEEAVKKFDEETKEFAGNLHMFELDKKVSPDNLAMLDQLQRKTQSERKTRRKQLKKKIGSPKRKSRS